MRTNGARAVVGIVMALTMVCGICLVSDVRAGESRARGRWQMPDVVTDDGDLAAPQPILEIHLKYRADDTPALRIKRMAIKRGYVPQVEPLETGYVLSLHAADGSVLSSLTFHIPNRVFDPPPESGTFADGAPVILRAMEFSLTVPWIAEAVEFHVADPEGQVIITASLQGIPVKAARPNFHSIRHAPTLRAPDARPSLPRKHDHGAWLFDWLMETAEAATTDGTALDVTFVGDNYAIDDLPLFQQDVDRAIAHLIAYEPYASRADQVFFHRVDNATVDLGCLHSATTDRLITCNTSTVTSVVNDAGAPYDKIIVLVKDDAYGGSGGSVAVSYNGGSMPEVVAHEFGHTLGGLLDEYNLYSTNGTTSGQTYANCYAGTPPAADWDGLADPGAYATGCKYPNWFRSSPCSIMLSLGCPYFNAVSQRQLNAKLDLFAGNMVPTVTLTASPSMIGLSGAATLTWSANHVTECHATDGWSGTQPLSGSQAVTPGATTKFGLTCSNALESASQQVTVTVDAQVPSVAMSAPANDATVQDTVTVAATATDNRSVDRVDFYRDGGLIGSDNNAPFSLSWDTRQEAVGAHALTARAIDVAGNAAVSAPATVTVQRNADTQAPQVTIVTPVDGSVVSKVIKVSSTATDNVKVVRLELYIDGVLKTSRTKGVLNITWNVRSSSVAPGLHTITALATDAAGNVGQMTVTIVK